MVLCLVCNKQFKMITNSHLKRAHNRTTEQYLAEYPGAKLYDKEMLAKIKESRHTVVRPICGRPGCEDRVSQSWNTYCSYSCSMSHRMSKDGRNEQAGSGNHKYDGGWYALGKAQKRLARERDNHTCRRCQRPVKGKEAHVHHVVPERCFDVPSKAHDLDNLITLCDRCHLRVEWETVRELYRRALLLDEHMQGTPGFKSFEEFKKELTASNVVSYNHES